MQLKRRALVLPFLAALSLTGCHPSQTQMLPLPGSSHPSYTITDLGAGLPYGINNRGQVVGEYIAGTFPKSKNFPYFHGCLWEKGKRTEMPTLGGWYSDAGRITDAGLVVGDATVPGRDTLDQKLRHRCLWDGMKLTDLDADPRFHGTSALHITKTGAVYAVSPPEGPKQQLHLWFYPAGFGPGVRRDVGVVGGPKIKPLFINDRGMVVGTWDTGEQRGISAAHHGFVWHRGDTRWMDIGTFGGSQSEPTGTNDLGQVIGIADLWDDSLGHRSRSHAFLWEKGEIKDLGTLPGGYLSHPYAINNQGQVVGFSVVDGNGLDFRPVLWEHGQIKDLSHLIPSGTSWSNIGGAESINDKGQIVGDGSLASPNEHYAHGYLLTPRLNPQGS